MNNYDRNLINEFAYLSNLELEILVNCKVRSYFVKKKAICITKYLLEEYGYVGAYGIDEVSLDKEFYRILRLAKLRMVSVYNSDVVVKKEDVFEIIKIYKDRDKSMSINNELFFDEMMNSITDEMLIKYNGLDKNISVVR